MKTRISQSYVTHRHRRHSIQINHYNDVKYYFTIHPLLTLFKVLECMEALWEVEFSLSLLLELWSTRNLLVALVGVM